MKVLSQAKETLAQMVQEAMGDPFEEYFLTDEQLAEEWQKARGWRVSCPADGSDPEALADWLEELDICN